MRRCATAFVVTLLATACGDVVTSEPEGLVEATSSIAPGTTGVDTDADADAPAADLPLGYELVEVESAGLAFAAPADWESIDPDRVLGTGTAAAEEIADRLGISVEQLQSTVNVAMDVMVIEPFGLVFSDNINLITIELDEVPPVAFIERDLESFGAIIVGTKDVSGPGASGVQVDYELTIGGGTVEGSSVALLINGLVRNFTVSTDDRADTEELAVALIESARAL